MVVASCGVFYYASLFLHKDYCSNRIFYIIVTLLNENIAYLHIKMILLK